VNLAPYTNVQTYLLTYLLNLKSLHFYITDICVILIGKGLTLVGSVIEGDYAEKYASAQAAKQTVTAMMKKEKAPGFAEVIVADSTVQGLSYL